MDQNEYRVERYPNGEWGLILSDDHRVMVFESGEKAFCSMVHGAIKDFPAGTTFRVFVEDGFGQPAKYDPIDAPAA